MTGGRTQRLCALLLRGFPEVSLWRLRGRKAPGIKGGRQGKTEAPLPQPRPSSLTQGFEFLVTVVAERQALVHARRHAPSHRDSEAGQARAAAPTPSPRDLLHSHQASGQHQRSNAGWVQGTCRNGGRKPRLPSVRGQLPLFLCDLGSIQSPCPHSRVSHGPVERELVEREQGWRLSVPGHATLEKVTAAWGRDGLLTKGTGPLEPWNPGTPGIPGTQHLPACRLSTLLPWSLPRARFQGVIRSLWLSHS